MTATEPLPAVRGWRDDGFYTALAAAGRPALAWEALRRDSAYRVVAAEREAGQSSECMRIARRPFNPTAMTRHGLLFRRGPGPPLQSR